MKLAFIGGGSYSWGPALLGDLTLSTTLSGTICLMDINPVAGERLQRLGRVYVADQRSALNVTYSSSLPEALEGADFVILSITTGGLEAMRGDLEIPEIYGIYQAVGDTVGPGGLSRTLRNVPVVVDIARQMERYCPQAWLLNVTNPMTTLCRAVTKATAVRTIGLCHELRSVQRKTRRLLGSDDGLDRWRVAGINHFPWLVSPDRDSLMMVRERLARVLPTPDPLGSSGQDNFRVKMDLLDLYGTFPAAGDRHVCEFMPGYLRSPAEAFDRHGVMLTTIRHREVNLAADVETVLRQLDGRDRTEIRTSGEQVVPIMEALSGAKRDALISGGHRSEFVVNIPNRGQVQGLPDGVVVECMATIDREGVTPITAPPLPGGVLAWVQTHVATHELVVQAALEQRFDLALQALRNDPLSYRLSASEAKSMLQALITANDRFLPPQLRWRATRPA
jgi:alpha-galactosidase/6-phospho-beta-glucosidase family protein